ncbi:MAG TPA: MoaD/ThiS family protein [Gemmatimonadales bacterium]|nr:MoaD/ThiS family protein [Gemmatimonadales bacterium]
MIRVALPAPLRALARIDGEVQVAVAEPVTLGSVLDAVEAGYPALRGTIRDQVTRQRRPFMRFFACEQDLSHQTLDASLPGAVRDGSEPLLVVGAIAGG